MNTPQATKDLLLSIVEARWNHLYRLDDAASAFLFQIELSNDPTLFDLASPEIKEMIFSLLNEVSEGSKLPMTFKGAHPDAEFDATPGRLKVRRLLAAHGIKIPD